LKDKEFGASLMKVVLILLLICGAAIGQTSSDLRQRYGPPASETFKVRPEIIVTVIYDEAGKVSEMVIEPQLDTTLIKSQYKRIKSQMLKEIIDELVPPKVRGKFVMGTFLNMTCLPENDCQGASDEYENVIVYRNGGNDAHRYATIQWKKLGPKIMAPHNNSFNPTLQQQSFHGACCVARLSMSS
jgi:hypothetical protein